MRAMVQAWLAGGGTQKDIIYALRSIDPKLTASKIRTAFKKDFQDGGNLANLKVMSKAFELCMEKNVTMIKFWLSARSGWVEKTASEVSGPGGGSIDVANLSKTDKLQRLRWA